MGVPLDSLHTPHSRRQTRFPYPGFPQQSPRSLAARSNLILLQQQSNSWSCCLPGGTPKKGNSKLLYSHGLWAPKSGVFPLGPRLLQCLSVRSPGWVTGPGVLCCAKHWQFLASCLRLPARLNQQLPLQLHPELPPLNRESTTISFPI